MSIKEPPRTSATSSSSRSASAMADVSGKESDWDLQKDYGDDFMVINDSIMICKFCDVVFSWRRRSRISEHRASKLHQMRKRSKLIAWASAAEEDLERQEDDQQATEHKLSPMDNEQYCLRWKHHESNLLRVFTRLFAADQFTDVVLAAEGRTIRAHKVVLSACSDYFEKLFLEFDEKNQIVILRETPFKDIAAIVEFMYKGEVNLSQSQLPSLLQTAKSLKVKGLAEVTSNDDMPTSATTPPSKTASTIPSKTVAIGSSSGRSTSSLNENEVHFSTSGTEPGSIDEDYPAAKRKRGRPRLTETIAAETDPLFTSNDVKPSSSTSFRSNDMSITDEANISAGEYPWMHSNDNAMLAAMGGFGGAAESEEIEPTPGGPLTEERIQTLGIVKMNDYIKSGTRQQFWEEYYVRVIMQAVRNREIDMKGGAELLGVSYGTLYGRYRELFGYVKHGWNISGRPMKSGLGAVFPPAAILADPNNHHIFDQLRDGKISILQAATLLGIDSTSLALQLSGKMPEDDSSQYQMEDDDDNEDGFRTDQVLSNNRDDDNMDGQNHEAAALRVGRLGSSVTIRRVLTQQQQKRRTSATAAGGGSAYNDEDGVDPTAR